MTLAPVWLPAMFNTNGEWNAVLAGLYAIFVRDIKQGKLELERRPVWWDKRVLPGELYEEGFWHLISRGAASGDDRLFDPRRAERLPWCGPTVRNARDAEVRVWDYEEGTGNIRTYVWLHRFDYLLVFQKKDLKKWQIAFLITAYHLDGPKSRDSVERKYRQRIQ